MMAVQMCKTFFYLKKSSLRVCKAAGVCTLVLEGHSDGVASVGVIKWKKV